MISKDEWEHYNINNDGHKAPRCFSCSIGIDPSHGGDPHHIIEQVQPYDFKLSKLKKMNTYRRLYFCVPCFTYIAGDMYKVALK